MKKQAERGNHQPSTENVQESRRKFLEQAGKLAIYTPPSMMLLMKPSPAATILSGLGNGICVDCSNGEFNGEFNGEYTGNSSYIPD